MNLCASRSLNLIKCVRGPALLQPAAHYNDNPALYLKKKKERRHHINRMRKSVMLRKMLAEYEPTPHDNMFDEAVRFSEAEFRAQLLHLRGEWGAMYSALDLAAQKSRDKEYSRLEEDRSAFIEEIEARQAEKRARGPPDRHAEEEVESVEGEYRRTLLTSPEIEVESFMKLYQEGRIVTPETFDDFIDSLLSDDKGAVSDVILVGKEKLRELPAHGIEYVLDGSTSSSISGSASSSVSGASESQSEQLQS